MTEKVRDVVIVGSSPAGWVAAIYMTHVGFKPSVVTGALEAGETLMDTTEAENSPGQPNRIMGPDLMDRFQAQTQKFGVSVEHGGITEFQLEGGVRIVITDPSTYKVRVVILALDLAYRELGLEDERPHPDKGVSYCATCDGFFFKGEEIAVVGGGDSALIEILFLTYFDLKVYPVHRRNQFRALKVLADRVAANPRIEIYQNKTIPELSGGEALESVTFIDIITGETSVLPVVGLFVATGHGPHMTLVHDETTLDGAGYILVEKPPTRADVSGVFVTGDAIGHTYCQAITAASSRAHVVLGA